jgi:hypothetical protein
MGFDQLFDVIFEHFIRHSELAIWIEQLLVKEEAIRASQVTGGSTGFG